MGPPPALKLARIWPVDSEVVSQEQADGRTQCSRAGLVSLARQAMKSKKKRMIDVSGAAQESIGNSVKHLKKSFQTCEGTEGKCTLAFFASSTGTRAEQNSR